MPRPSCNHGAMEACFGCEPRQPAKPAVQRPASVSYGSSDYWEARRRQVPGRPLAGQSVSQTSEMCDSA